MIKYISIRCRVNDRGQLGWKVRGANVKVSAQLELGKDWLTVPRNTY